MRLSAVVLQSVEYGTKFAFEKQLKQQWFLGIKFEKNSSSKKGRKDGRGDQRKDERKKKGEGANNDVK